MYIASLSLSFFYISLAFTMSSFLTLGIERLSEATKADSEDDDKAKALQLYIQSIEIFHKAAQYSKEKVQKQAIEEKIKEILQRAETLKKAMSEDESNGSSRGGGGGGEKGKKGGGGGSSVKGKKSGGGGAGEDDPDRFTDALEGCVVAASPNVTWDMIAGLEGAKEALHESVILPLRFPQLFRGKRRPWQGILLYGPPGTGKSYLAKAVATASSGTFFSVSSADLLSRWMGESEKMVRQLFGLARQKAQETKRSSVIFVDEIDSLTSSRSEGENEASRRVKTEFLIQMQGVQSGRGSRKKESRENGDHQNDDKEEEEEEGEARVLLLAATNIPWTLDSAIRRRFERRIYIPLPDKTARVQMFKIHLGDTPHTLSEANLKDLAARTDMYSGSDIENVVRNALMESVRALQIATHFRRVPGPDPRDAKKTVPNRIVPCSPGAPGAFESTLNDLKCPELLMELPVSYADFCKSLMTAKPSVSANDLSKYEEFTAEFGQED